METLGFFGIIERTVQIILTNLRHFLCIALILSLPLALSLLLEGPSFFATSIQPLTDFISFLLKSLLSEDGASPPVPAIPEFDESTFHKLHPHPVHDILLSTALLIVSIAVSLICTPLLTVSACRACLKRSVDMRGSARGMRRSLRRYVVTVLCLVGAMVGAWVVVGVVWLAIAAVAAEVGGGVWSGVIGVVAVLGVAGGVVYVIVGLSLAQTVAILEEGEQGWGAMKRSMHLLGGGCRKGMAIGLILLLGACSLLLLPLLVSESWVLQGFGRALQALLGLFCMVAQVVLYMTCRARLQEPLDTLLLAGLDFVPLHSSHSKHLDLETAAFITTVP